MLSWRGAVKAVPESFSAYRPRAGFWGEFAPIGRAPFAASDLVHVSTRLAAREGLWWREREGETEREGR